MMNYLKTLLLASLVLAMASCQKETIIESEIASVDQISSDLPADLQVIAENLAKEGLKLEVVSNDIENADKVIETIEGEKTYFKDFDPSNAKLDPYTPWIRMTLDDMKHMIGTDYYGNPDYYWYRDRFAARIGSGTTKPVNVCINNERVGTEGYNPVPDYNWWCERRLKVDNVITSTGATIVRQVPGTTKIRVYNYYYVPKDCPSQILYSSTYLEESNWYVSATAGIAVTGKVGLPFGIAGGEVEVSLSVEAGGGGSHSNSVANNTPSPILEIPARSYAEFTCFEYYVSKTYRYPVPMEVSGYVGADYGWTKWDGHHWWAIGATSFWSEYANKTEKFNAYLNDKYGHYVWVSATTHAF
jgi:hypothetical protein